jgi:PKD repeat protein
MSLALIFVAAVTVAIGAQVARQTDAASGIAISGSFYAQQFQVPQGGSAIGPSIYVVVANSGSDVFNVRMVTTAVTSDDVSVSGISINLSRVNLSLQPGAQQRVQIGVGVAESVPAGQYEISVVAESYQDSGGGISVLGSAGQTASLTVTGESASVVVNAVGPSGQPVAAQVRLFRMVGGSGYEVANSNAGTLQAKVAPGTFSAEAYSLSTGDQLCDAGTFDVAAGQDKTITLTVQTVYLEDDFMVSAISDSETKKLLSARTMATLTNVYQAMANAEVRLAVTFNGDPLEELTVLGPLSLPLGRTGVPWNFIPADGWKSGLYGFKYQVYVGGQLMAESVKQTLPHADFLASSVKSSEGRIIVFFSNLSSGGVAPLTYAWDFENDGTVDSTEREPWHCYSTSGTYAVRLIVTDSAGNTDVKVSVNCLTIFSSDGGSAETSDGQVSTEFPSGAVPGAAMVTIGRMTSSGLPEVPEAFTIADTCFVIMALDESGKEIVTLSQPSTITVRYSEADLAAAGGDPNKLVLAYWDEAAGQWKALKTTADTAEMTLSASTTHLSTWAVLARTTSASNGLRPWLWIVIGLVGALVVGMSTYLVAKRATRH